MKYDLMQLAIASSVIYLNNTVKPRYNANFGDR